MGDIFTLSPTILSPAQKLFDDIINEMGRDCKLYYPPKLIAATPSNMPKPVSQSSNNSMLSGGTNPYLGESISSVEGGNGQMSETFDVVKFVVHYNPTKFGEHKIEQVRIAKGLLKTEGFIWELPKVMKCAYIVPDPTLEGYGRYKYRLCEDPVANNNIVRGRYFECLWERVQ